MSENKGKSQPALREEEVLKFWEENRIFEKSLEKKSPKGNYVFYEGPPTANGKPGIHHLEARAFKDVIPRYKTMNGYYVRRKGGWDTHGLPVELQVEKALGLTSKKEIEEYGIGKFNQECKKSVWEYLEYWNDFTKRIGFWLDQKNPYVTYHNDYIESVWNVIKEANKQKLLYKDYKVVPWCPRCGTGLSSHELAQGYEDVKDLSVYVKFRIVSSSDAFSQVLGRGERESGPDHSKKYTEELPTYILAWTTTPWTLPGNVALAVGENIDYVKIEKENEFFILAKNRLSVIGGEYKIISEFKGKDLVGLEYEPLYPYLKNVILKEEKSKLEKAYKVYPASFVTTEDGTGVVHTAVMYGVDDFNLGTEIGLPKCHLVGLDGKFIKGTDFLENRFVRDEDVAVDIIKDLAGRGLLLKKEKYEHSYPHCWRCKTALIYYARDSWYIKMTALRDKMVKENKGINWEPAYIKDGRFGEWLRDIKDWAISRERYWGTPLPVWQCNKCQKIEVLGSVEDIKSKTKKSGNKYFVMRHGQAESNIKGISNYKFDPENKLTKVGEKQVKESVNKIKKENFDFIFSSSLPRTKQTAEIICDEIGFDKNKIIFDDRLLEFNTGDYEGKTTDDFHNFIRSNANYLETKFPNGESPKDLFIRMGNFMYDIDKKYSDKSILIISHGDPIMDLFILSKGYEKSKILKQENDFVYLKNAEIRELDFTPLPHNENYELDLHKPYIDEVELNCDCGGDLIRTKEVMDVWLDSGAMPFAQDHYPFNKKIDYPADFISEAIDQTRGWFYTLHAVGAIMGKGKVYKNVICLGHVLDAKGKKMSKSIGNVVNPWEMIDKYGVDTLRLWMYSVNQPGDSKNFDEKTVLELHNKVFNLLYNVLAFYELYRDVGLENKEFNKSNNILDKWIIARLNELTENTTKHLENYKLLEPVREIRDFIDDLSTWYLRRSRERIKEGDKEAKQTLYFVLKTLIKIMAPFTPFASEDIWQKLKTEGDEESVHLAKWPENNKSLFNFSNKRVSILDEMIICRDICTIGNSERQINSLPIRQPVNNIFINKKDSAYSLIKNNDQILEIIKEELNVKNIIFKEINQNEKKIQIDTNITPELKQEGQYRELVRAIQDMRKKSGLNPTDIISLNIQTNNEGQKLLNNFKDDFLKVVNVKEFHFTQTDGNEIKIGDLIFQISIL